VRFREGSPPRRVEESPIVIAARDQDVNAVALRFDQKRRKLSFENDGIVVLVDRVYDDGETGWRR
jgi:NAD-dependent DNA ligase